MRHFFFFILISFSVLLHSHAQEVYQAVLISAQDVIDNPKSDDTQIKIAQFKLNTLNYMHRKFNETAPDTPARKLDEQAYYMNAFLTTFFVSINKNINKSNNIKKENIMKFIEASVSSPMFNDKNHKLTYTYIEDGDNLTPFCLDTDWEKAYNAIQ